MYTPGARAKVTATLDSRVNAAKQRSAHIAESEFADQSIADIKESEASADKKETDVFSDEEEIMPPKKSTEASSTDQIAGMMD